MGKPVIKLIHKDQLDVVQSLILMVNNEVAAVHTGKAVVHQENNKHYIELYGRDDSYRNAWIVDKVILKKD